MNESQSKAWDRHRQEFVIDVPEEEKSTSIARHATVDWVAEFGRDAPLIVEIGCGNGGSLVPMAEGRAGSNVVAFEVFQPAVASVLGKIGRAGVSNLRVVMVDGAQALEKLFDDRAISELWTFFADPWHKKRHHKRRLIQPAFVELLCRKLKSGGLLHLATDWEPYAQHMWDVLEAQGLLSNVNGPRGSAPRPAWRPETHFERRGQRLGHGVWDLLYRRND